MGDVDLERLSSDIKSLVTNKNSYFFHNIVGQLAELLDFKKADEWYEAVPIGGPPLQFYTREELGKTSQRVEFINYAHRKKYAREDDFLISTTNHQTLESLDKEVCVDRNITSNSTLGLENKIVPYEEVRERFPPIRDKDSLELAFEADYIIKSPDSLYCLHPGFLYDLVLKKLGSK